MIKAALLALAAIGATTAVVLHGRADGAETACLEQGGLWFGEVGCETSRPRIDRIVIDKSDRKLTAYAGDAAAKTFLVALGREPVGQKQRQGDSRTPEGVYPIIEHKADSAYHRALRLGYPTPEQRADAEAAGIDPGGDIMIHGLPNSTPWLGAAHRARDWTLGCIALTNDEIEWLYRFAANGVPVEIRP